VIAPSLHPIDDILAEVGMMARRAKSGTLVPAEFRGIERRIRSGVVGQGVDRNGSVRALLDALVLAADARDLTRAQVAATMDRIRDHLTRARDASLPVVPNFAVLPSGVHGRPLRPALTVIDGGRTDHPEN